MKTTELELAELSLESVDVKNKHSAIVIKRKPIEAELASLTGRVRGSYSHRNRISQEDYRQLVNRQTVLKRQLAEMEVAAAPLKARLREIGALSTLYYATRIDVRADEAMKAAMPADSQIRKTIIWLRGKWLAFAEDQTRVNSMRVMAAQFSRELTDILAAPEAP